MKPLVRLSRPQQALFNATPEAWGDVPPATRSKTVLSLVRLGLIEHRYKQPRHWKDWVTWGEIRKANSVPSVNPPANPTGS